MWKSEKANGLFPVAALTLFALRIGCVTSQRRCAARLCWNSPGTNNGVTERRERGHSVRLFRVRSKAGCLCAIFSFQSGCWARAFCFAKVSDDHAFAVCGRWDRSDVGFTDRGQQSFSSFMLQKSRKIALSVLGQSGLPVAKGESRSRQGRK